MMKPHTSKLTDEINNPCLKCPLFSMVSTLVSTRDIQIWNNEQKLTYKCLNDNNFDRDICTNYFVNYNACKEFWNRVRADRRSQGIAPYLPLPEDRPRIKAEYLKKGSKN